MLGLHLGQTTAAAYNARGDDAAQLAQLDRCLRDTVPRHAVGALRNVRGHATRGLTSRLLVDTSEVDAVAG